MRWRRRRSGRRCGRGYPGGARGGTAGARGPAGDPAHRAAALRADLDLPRPTRRRRTGVDPDRPPSGRSSARGRTGGRSRSELYGGVPVGRGRAVPRRPGCARAGGAAVRRSTRGTAAGTRASTWRNYWPRHCRGPRGRQCVRTRPGRAADRPGARGSGSRARFSGGRGRWAGHGGGSDGAGRAAVRSRGPLTRPPWNGRPVIGVRRRESRSGPPRGPSPASSRR